MTQLEVLKQKAKNAMEAENAWRVRASQLQGEKLSAQSLSIILAVCSLASNGGWFCAYMWL